MVSHWNQYKYISKVHKQSLTNIKVEIFRWRLGTYLIGGEGFDSLFEVIELFSRLEELVDDVWYWGGGGGSFVGNPNGCTIFIGLNLVTLLDVFDEIWGWFPCGGSCAAPCGVCLGAWLVWVIVTRLVLFSLVEEVMSNSATKIFRNCKKCFYLEIFLQMLERSNKPTIKITKSKEK